MAEDKLTAKIKAMAPTFVSLNTINVDEVGKAVFDTDNEDFDGDENPRGKFVTTKAKYSLTLAALAGLMIVADSKNADPKKIKVLAPTTDKLYRNDNFISFKRLVQDADDNAKPVSQLELKCVGHAVVLDPDSGKELLNPWNYNGDREFYKAMRTISAEREMDPEKDYTDSYSAARKALVSSGVKTTGNPKDFQTRPIFSVQ